MWMKPIHLYVSSLRRHAALFLALLGQTYSLCGMTDTALLLLYRSLAIDPRGSLTHSFLFSHHIRFSPLALSVRHLRALVAYAPITLINGEACNSVPLRYPLGADHMFSGEYIESDDGEASKDGDSADNVIDESETDESSGYHPFMDILSRIAASSNGLFTPSSLLSAPFPSCSTRCLTSRLLDRPHAISMGGAEATQTLAALTCHSAAAKRRNEIAWREHMQQLDGASNIKRDGEGASIHAGSASTRTTTPLVISLSTLHPLHSLHPFTQQQSKLDSLALPELLSSMPVVQPLLSSNMSLSRRRQPKPPSSAAPKPPSRPGSKQAAMQYATTNTPGALTKRPDTAPTAAADTIQPLSPSTMPSYLYVDHRSYYPPSQALSLTSSNSWGAGAWYKEGLRLLAAGDSYATLLCFLRALQIDMDFCPALNYILSLLETSMDERQVANNVESPTTSNSKKTNKKEVVGKKRAAQAAAEAEAAASATDASAATKHTSAALASLFGADRVLPITWDLLSRGKSWCEEFGLVDWSMYDWSFALRFVPLSDIHWRRALVLRSRDNIPMTIEDVSLAIQHAREDLKHLQSVLDGSATAAANRLYAAYGSSSRAQRQLPQKVKSLTPGQLASRSEKEKKEHAAVLSLASNAHTPHSSLTLVRIKLESFHLFHAMLLYQTRDYAKSISACTACLHLNKSNAAALRLQSLSQSELGNHAAAIRTLERYFVLVPHDLGSRLRMAHLLSFIGEHDAAFTIFNKLLVNSPRNPQLLYGQALTYIRLHMWNESEEVLGKLIDLAPTMWLAHLRMAEVRERMEKYELAIHAAITAIDGATEERQEREQREKLDGEKQAMIGVGMYATAHINSHMSSTSFPDPLVEPFVQANSIASTPFPFVSAHKTLGRIYLAQAQQAYMAYAAEQEEEKRKLRKAKEKSSVHHTPFAHLSANGTKGVQGSERPSTSSRPSTGDRSRPSTASSAAINRMWSTVLSKVSASVRAAADSVYSHQAILVATQSLQRAVDALQQALAALRSTPHSISNGIPMSISSISTRQSDEIETCYLLSLSLLFLYGNRSGDIGGRIRKLLDRILRLDKNHSDARFIKAIMLCRDGQGMEAAKELDACLHLDPSHPFSLHLRAALHLEAGALQPALNLYGLILQQPVTPYLRNLAHANRGLIHLRLGHPSEALSELDRSLQNSSSFSSHALPFLFRAQVYRMMNDASKAIDDYRQAVRLVQQAHTMTERERRHFESKRGRKITRIRAIARTINDNPINDSSVKDLTSAPVSTRPDSNTLQSRRASTGKGWAQLRSLLLDQRSPLDDLAASLSLTHTQPSPSSSSPLTSSRTYIGIDPQNLYVIGGASHFRIQPSTHATAFQPETGLGAHALDAIKNTLGIMLHSRAAQRRKESEKMQSAGSKSTAISQSNDGSVSFDSSSDIDALSPSAQACALADAEDEEALAYFVNSGADPLTSNITTNASSSGTHTHAAPSTTTDATAHTHGHGATAGTTGSSNLLFQSHFNRGLLYLEQSSLIAAAREFRRALECATSKEKKDAVSTSISALSIASCHNNLGVSLEQLGDNFAAAEHYQRALELTDGSHTMASFNLANSKTRSKQYQEAMRLYTQFLTRCVEELRKVVEGNRRGRRNLNAGNNQLPNNNIPTPTGTRDLLVSSATTSATSTGLVLSNTAPAAETVPPFELELLAHRDDSDGPIASARQSDGEEKVVDEHLASRRAQPSHTAQSLVDSLKAWIQSPATSVNASSSSLLHLCRLVPLALNNRAICFHSLCMYTDALQGYTSALELDPTLGYVRFNRAHLHMTRGDCFEAIKDIQTYTKEVEDKLKRTEASDGKRMQAQRSVSNSGLKGILSLSGSSLTPSPSSSRPRTPPLAPSSDLSYLHSFFDYCQRYQWGLAVASKDLFVGIQCLPLIQHTNLNAPILPPTLFNPHTLGQGERSRDWRRLMNAMSKLKMCDVSESPKTAIAASNLNSSLPLSLRQHLELALKWHEEHRYEEVLDVLLKAIYMLPAEKPTSTIVKERNIASEPDARPDTPHDSGCKSGCHPPDFAQCCHCCGSCSPSYSDLYSDLHELLVVWRARLLVYLDRLVEALKELEIYVESKGVRLSDEETVRRQKYEGQIDDPHARLVTSLDLLRAQPGLSVQRDDDGRSGVMSLPRPATPSEFVSAAFLPPSLATAADNDDTRGNKTDEKKKSVSRSRSENVKTKSTHVRVGNHTPTATGTSSPHLTLPSGIALASTLPAPCVSLHPRSIRLCRVLCYLGVLRHLSGHDAAALHAYSAAIDLDDTHGFNLHATINRLLLRQKEKRFADMTRDIFRVIDILSLVETKQTEEETSIKRKMRLSDTTRMSSRSVCPFGFSTLFPRIRFSPSQRHLLSTLVEYGRVLERPPHESWGSAINQLQGQVALAIDAVRMDRQKERQQLGRKGNDSNSNLDGKQGDTHRHGAGSTPPSTTSQYRQDVYDAADTLLARLRGPTAFVPSARMRQPDRVNTMPDSASVRDVGAVTQPSASLSPSSAMGETPSS